MAQLVFATGRQTALIALLFIRSGSTALGRDVVEGSSQRASSTALFASPWIVAMGALALVLAGVWLQAIRSRPLRERNAELERLLEDRGSTIEQLRVEIESAKRMVSEAERESNRFLANVSHELRTPLNSILGFSELLLEGVGSIAEDKQTRFLSNVRRSAHHLLSLINDVVDMSKIESGRMELHVDRLAVAPLVASTVEMITAFAAPRRITVSSQSAPELPMIFADAVKVRQIVYNLLSNAVRFSVAGATVELDVRLVEIDRSPLAADAIELRVSDHGSGIPEPAVRALLAEERNTAIYAKLGLGPGLALAIVRRFAEMHGGRLTVDSRPGEGSTFRVFLPLDARELDTDKISMKV